MGATWTTPQYRKSFKKIYDLNEKRRKKEKDEKNDDE